MKATPQKPLTCGLQPGGRFLAAIAAALLITMFNLRAATPLQIAQEAYLKASNTGAGDSFGSCVAASGDTVVVGVAGEASNASGVNGNQSDNTAGGSGAAYVFVRNGRTWIQQAYLKASNTGASDLFGTSVAIAGDTVLVGAPSEDSNADGVNGNQSDNSATDSGAAYVFVRRGTNWSQQAYLKAFNPEAHDRFGEKVGASGDTVVVGAPYEDSNAIGVNGSQSDNSATNSGAAYVFVRSGTNWSQQAYLKASNTGADDRFGSAVSVSGDMVAVGAPWEASSAIGINGNQGDNSAPYSGGAVYVFVRGGANWSQQAYLKAPSRGASHFGWSVAVSGDTIVVGPYADYGIGYGAGAAYVFLRRGTSWTEQALLRGSNTEGGVHSREIPGDCFGRSVAVAGDTVVVGAVEEDSATTGVNGNEGDNSSLNSGAAYVFVRHGTTWNQHAYLKASNAEGNTTGGDRSPYLPGDSFGGSVAVSDGVVVVGAPNEDSAATGVDGDQCDNRAPQSGAAYLFELNASAAPAVPATAREIVVEQPAGTDLTNGSASVDFGSVLVPGLPVGMPGRPGIVPPAPGRPVAASVPGMPSNFPQRSLRTVPLPPGGLPPRPLPVRDGVRTFTVKNTGHITLTNLGITITGAHSNDFRVTTQPAASVYGPCGTTTFAVTFTPGGASPRTATLHFASNDSDESPFNITLTGTGLGQPIYTPYAFTNFAGLPGSPGSADGIGSAARFNGPLGMAVDSAGNVYVSDSRNHTVRRITPTGEATTLAGSAGQSGSADGSGYAARFLYPSGLAVDSAGVVYVADAGNHTIRKIIPTGAVTTLAGSAGQSGSTDGIGRAAQFNEPDGLAVDSAGNLYVAEAKSFTIRKITPAGAVTTLAGSAGQSGSADGTGSTARFGIGEGFSGPHGVAVDSAGNVYVADFGNRTVRKITPAGVVTTLAGSVGQAGSGDGLGSAARFFYPSGVAVDSMGNIYVTESPRNHTIRRVAPPGTATTLAGSAGQAGRADGIGIEARFDHPEGVAVDSAGNVYVADYGNNRITKGKPALTLSLPTETPATRLPSAGSR